MKHALKLAGVLLCPLGLLPLGKAVVARIPLFRVHEAARHLPTMLDIEVPAQRLQLGPVVGHLHRAHSIGIDPAPYRMGMAANLPIHAAFFVENDGARLTGEAEAFFRPAHRIDQ